MSGGDNKNIRNGGKIISMHDVEREQDILPEGRSLDIGKIIAGILVLFLVLALLIFLYNRFNKYTKYTVSAEKDMSAGSFVAYASFASDIIKYSKDGVLYMDESGKELWIDSYEMKDPFISVSQNYIAIADRKGNLILTFDKNGRVGEIRALLPISKMVISDTGVVASLVEDSNASYINFYNYDGTAVDISIKSKLSGDGYPTDLSLSPGGQQLIVAYQYVQAGELRGRVVFYDFSEIGKSIANRLVGGFDEAFVNSLIARVRYMDANYSFALADTGIYFFSSRNLLSPELIKSYPVGEEQAEEIHAASYNDKYVALVYKLVNAEKPYRFTVYRANGSLLFSKDLEGEYSYFGIDKNNVYFYMQDGVLRIYNMSGQLKFEAPFEMDMEYMQRISLADNKYIVLSASKLQEIKLK